MSTIISEITQQVTPDVHLVRDVSTVLSELDADLYSLDTLTRRMKPGPPATQVKIEWEEDDILPRTDTVTADEAGGAAGATTTPDVANGSMWRKDDIIYTPDIPTNPAFLIESISTNTLTIRALGIRSGANPTGFGTVPALPAGTVLAWLGNARYEGFTTLVGRTTMPEQDFNLCELFDSTIYVTKTREATKNYTMNDWLRARRKQLAEFRKDIEGKLWFNERSETKDATSQELRWTMRGVTRFLTKQLTYDKDIVGAPRITESQVMDWLADVFGGNNGSSSRFLFADTYLATELSKIMLTSLRSRRIEKVVGVKVEVLEFSFGEVYIKHQRFFNLVGKNHYGVILDMENIYKRELRPMERTILDLKKGQGTDKDAEQYLEQCSLEVRNKATHAEIIGN